MTDERDDIRSRSNIVDLVGQRVILKRAGKHFTGLCPFHDDKRPSFTVDPTTGRYRCWSCNESGDVFTWVMKTENMDFPEAMEFLAHRAGIQLATKGRGPSTKENPQIQEAMGLALKTFKESLALDREATAYCERRGLDRETLDRWQIGFAPLNGEALTGRLKKSALPLNLCKDLFLVDQDGSGGYYDRFRGRLMFPILDERSNLVAFGGRLLGDGVPKYINSSDTPIFRKSRVLYGLNFAKTSLIASRKAVLVEGYLDVIACHRSGVEGAVASMGTALAEDHCKLLKRWCDGVTILYDSDAAGQKAAERAISLLEAEGLKVRIALMPQGEDPDTLRRTKGPEAVKAAVDAGMSPTAFKLRQLDLRSSPDQDSYWDEALEILIAAKEDLEREGHLLTLAGKYPHIKDVRTALERLTKMVKEKQKPKANHSFRLKRVEPNSYKLIEPLTAAELIVFGALHEPAFQKSAWIAMRTPEIFVTGKAIELSQAIQGAFPVQPPHGPIIDWIGKIEPEEMRQLLSDINMDSRNDKLTEEIVIDAVNSLQVKAVDRDLRKIRMGNLNSEERQELLERLRQLKPDQRSPQRSEDDDPFA